METSANKFEKQYQTVFEFVEFAKSVKPNNKSVALWHRLLTKDPNQETKERSVKAAKNFCLRYRDVIHNNFDFKSSTEYKMKYSDRIFINVHGLFQSSVDEEDKEAAKQFLLTISALVIDDEESLNRLSETLAATSGSDNATGLSLDNLGINTSTNEGKFLNDIVSRVSNVVQEGDTEDPQAAIMKLMTSGILTDITSGAKEKLDNGELSLTGVFGAMQSLIQNIESNSNEQPRIEEIETTESSNTPLNNDSE